MTASVRKFVFDTEFSASGEIFRADSSRRTSFTPEEVEHERQQAYARGREDAAARAAEAAAHATQALARQAQMIVGALAREAIALRRDAATLALVSARRIAGTALDRFGEDRVQAAVEDALAHLRHDPRVTVRVSLALAQTIGPMIEACAEAMDFRGALVVRAEPSMASGDVSLEWAGGSVVHERADILARIEAAIDARLAEADREGAQLDLFGGTP
jgi:flagellar assembly protein FliH